MKQATLSAMVLALAIAILSIYLAPAYGATPKGPGQPVSPLVVTATPTATATVTPTRTPLPRELQWPIVLDPGWSWVYGRGVYDPPTDDFLYRARFRSAEWKLMPGPVLRHRVLPDCTLHFLGAPVDAPPVEYSLLAPPEEMASTLALHSLFPAALFRGDQANVDFDSRRGACKSAGQAVLETIELAPPTPGFPITPTPVPLVLTRVDSRDPAWSVLSMDFRGGAHRYELFYRTADWNLDVLYGALNHSRIANCLAQIVDDSPGRIWGQGTLIFAPEPFAADPGVQSSLAVAAHYLGASDVDAVACSKAVKRLANSVHWSDNIYAQPLNR